MYRTPDGSPRPLMRREGQVLIRYREFVAMEEVMGPGGQIQSFEATFSPRGPDGEPLPLFDRATGDVDSEVARAWEKYDIRIVLERNWAQLKASLAGKIHVQAGSVDNYYLEGAVRLLGASLSSLGSDAEVVVTEGISHQRSPDIIDSMLETITTAEEARSIPDDVNLTRHPKDDRSAAWSPDSSRIVFETDRDGNWELYVLVVETRTLERLTGHPGEDRRPAWSPDGESLVFSSDRDGNLEIYAVELATGVETRLTHHKAVDVWPRVSQDGDHIVFFSQRDGNDEIYVMSRDGTALTRLTADTNNDFTPDWTPDGGVVFASNRAGKGRAQLYILRPNNPAPEQVTHDRGRVTEPAWSPDGQWLAFTSNRDGNNEIYVRRTRSLLDRPK